MMNKPTNEDLVKRFDAAYLKRSEQGDPERTYVSDCRAAAIKDLYDAGVADGKAEAWPEAWREAIEVLRAEVLKLQGEFRGVEADRALSAIATLERLAQERGYL
jgi:hypothetical protein